MSRGGSNKVYSPETAALAVKLVSEGKGYKQISEAIGIDIQTLAAWRVKYPSFDQEFTRAQETGFDVEADSLNEIAETETDVQRARLKCDNIKWRLARRAAHKYGDRIDVNVSGSVDLTAALTDARIRAQLPNSYPTDAIEAEYSEVKEIPIESATGSKSVAGNAAETDEPDIFS